MLLLHWEAVLVLLLTWQYVNFCLNVGGLEMFENPSLTICSKHGSPKLSKALSWEGFHTELSRGNEKIRHFDIMGQKTSL